MIIYQTEICVNIFLVKNVTHCDYKNYLGGNCNLGDSILVRFSKKQTHQFVAVSLSY